MIIRIKEVLGECFYALDEAKVNTELAISHEKDLEVKALLEEDYSYFCALQGKIKDKLSSYRNKKMHILGKN